MLAIIGLFGLLCACTPIRSGEGTIWQLQGTAGATPLTEQLAQTRGDAQEMRFAVSEDAPEILRAAAAYFCQELEEISQGSIHMTISGGAEPQVQLEEGTAQVALLHQKQQMEFSQPLQATATPFLYTGYRNFTVRANAYETISLLERSLRRDNQLVPLAAFYQGTRHFLTSFSVTNYLHLEGATLAVGEDDPLRESLGRLGAETVSAATLRERLELYESGTVMGLEISLEELSLQRELPLDSYLLLCGHHTVPAWLVAQAEFFDGLTPAQQAGVWELCAYMINLVDDRQVEREQQLLEELSLPNLGYITEFSNVRNRVFNTLEPLESEAPASQVVARDLVDMMRRITWIDTRRIHS